MRRTIIVLAIVILFVVEVLIGWQIGSAAPGDSPLATPTRPGSPLPTPTFDPRWHGRQITTTAVTLTSFTASVR
jgi:hypothetical protein